MLSGSTLVVVADGAFARFLRRERPGALLIESVDLAVRAEPAVPERDRAPRVHDSFGVGRHAIENRQTAHEIGEGRFLADVAARTVSAIQKQKPSCVVICAPPKALGILRASLESDVGHALVVSLAKDITRETASKIDERVRELGA